MPRSPSKVRNRKAPASAAEKVEEKSTAVTTDGMPPLKKCDEWIRHVNVLELERDFQALEKELSKAQGPDDVAHLHKIILWSQICSVLGLATMALPPSYLFPAVLLATATFIRWTCIGHHVCHGGYNNCVPKGSRFDRFKFAVGNVFRRLRDWPDWMLPEAWNVEHNHLHHYELNENSDPDLVEQNLSNLRESNTPLIFKYLFTLFNAATWKWFYYSSNTYASLKAHEKNEAAPLTTMASLYLGFGPSYLSRIEYTFRVIGPYIFYQFILMPLPFLMAARYAERVPEYEQYSNQLYAAHWNATLNLLISDVLTNLHSFLTIVTNHAGHDMYRWKTHCLPLTGAFFIRAVVSSANYSAGTDLIDCFHGWLNYQTEHHCFPKLSMLSYQKSMPKVKALCAKHGVPYTQENVFVRLKKTIDSMCGTTTMREVPLEWEERLNVTNVKGGTRHKHVTSISTGGKVDESKTH